MVRFLNAYIPRRTLLLFISEACLVSLAFIGATIARLGAGSATFVLTYQYVFGKLFVLSLTVVTCMYYFDLYGSSILSTRRELLIRLSQVLATVYGLVAIVYYLYPPLDLGGGIFLTGLVFAATLLLFWRRLFLVINRVPELAERVLILGDGSLAEALLHELESRPELGLRVVGRALGSGNALENCESARDRGPNNSTGVVEALSRTVELLRANRIIVAMGERRGKLPVEPLLSLKCQGVDVQDGIGLYEKITGKVPIDSLRLAWLLFSPGCHASRFGLIRKRCASIAVSIMGLLLSLPLVPFIILAIKLTSPGPALYRQERVGRDSRVFHCFKFRTMCQDAEADTGPTWARDDDPRITRVGRFLRQTRMDEIPQLWNVLIGDMSLVGPRPERPEFVHALAQQIPYYGLRHSIRPGITGWAQTRYRYANSVEDAREKLCYDLYYMKNMSAGLDVLIFLDTIKVILWGQGAK